MDNSTWLLGVAASGDWVTWMVVAQIALLVGIAAWVVWVYLFAR